MQSFLSALTFEFLQSIFNQTRLPTVHTYSFWKATCHSDGWVPFGKDWLLHKPVAAIKPPWLQFPTHVLENLFDAHCDDSNTVRGKHLLGEQIVSGRWLIDLGMNLASLSSVLNKATSRFFRSLKLVPFFVLVFQHHLQKWGKKEKGVTNFRSSEVPHCHFFLPTLSPSLDFTEILVCFIYLIL